MNAQEAAQALGITEKTARAWLASGRLRGVRQGRTWHVTEAAVARAGGSITASVAPAEAPQMVPVWPRAADAVHVDVVARLDTIEQRLAAIEQRLATQASPALREDGDALSRIEQRLDGVAGTVGRLGALVGPLDGRHGAGGAEDQHAQDAETTDVVVRLVRLAALIDQQRDLAPEPTAQDLKALGVPSPWNVTEQWLANRKARRRR